jgi:hypothetical protein
VNRTVESGRDSVSRAVQREPTFDEVLSPGSDLRRAVLYSLSGGLLAVAFGMFGCATAQAAPMPVDADGVSHARSEGRAQSPANSGAGKKDLAGNTGNKSTPSGGDSGKQPKATSSGNSGNQKKTAKAAKDGAEKTKAKSDESSRSGGNGNEQGRSSKSNGKMTDPAKAGEAALSVTPFGGVFVKSANAAKSAAEKAKAAQPKSLGSAGGVKLRAEDRKARASAGARAEATAVVQPKSLREQIGAAGEAAEESFEAFLRSSRQSAQDQIDEEKKDPNKTPDAGTVVRRFAAGAYVALHDNVTSAAELIDTLEDAAQGDEEASRKVEQTAKDIADGVGNIVSDPKEAAKKAAAAGDRALEGFKAAPVSGTGEVLANLAGYRKIISSAEGVAVTARAEAPTPKHGGTPNASAGRIPGAPGSSAPATGGGKVRPRTTVAPSQATTVPTVAGATSKPKPKAKATGAGTTGRPKVNLKRTEIDGTRHPESAQHIIDNLKPNAKGKYQYEGTVDRPGVKDRRKESMRGIPRKLFKDRDEWPQAVFKEGGKGASVRYINPSDNKGSGAALGNQLRGNKAGDYRIEDGTRIRVFVKPPKYPRPGE